MHKKIKVGKGILETITVALYENPIILFREYVQNSLDAYNKATDDGENTIKKFHVTIDVDKKKKEIVIRDNGYGIKTYNLFEQRMLSIGSSEKGEDRTKYIGFRGIGRISGLPFCEKLTFRNKVKNSDEIHECIWNGDQYRDLLSNEDAKDDLQSIVNKIVTISKKDIEQGKKTEHYFEVILENFGEEITGILEDRKMNKKLIKMLPLKYEKNFVGAKHILSKYSKFMNGEKLERFMIPVKYNGKDLYKEYDKKYILGSDIVFWEIRGKRKNDGSVGDKMGLLWFTFEKHLKSNKNEDYSGILTRSKNVLMGTNDTFAQVADTSKEYISTYREMVQALQGIYGELLINCDKLRDNSRRDWFLPDQHSTYLNNIITDFMQRLHNYRYCASRYFRSNPSKKKEDLKKALDELVNIEDNKINYDYFYKKEKEERTETDNKLFSEEDIPHASNTMKKYYDILMVIIEEHFNKERKRVLFLKLRAYIATHFKKK